MAWQASVLVIPLALVVDAAAQIPVTDTAAHEAAISRTREAALAYGDRLQNFTCVQTTARSIGRSVDGPRWKPLETQEFELNYVDHREHYKLLKVNGETTDLQKRITPGYFRGYGQFGSALMNIFDPKTNASFEWDHAESGTVGSVCVFRYQVPQSSSRIVITADKDQVKVGHHGTVWSHCDSGAVTRFVTETDPAEVRRLGRRVPLGYRLDVRYGRVTIGPTEFLLSQSAIQTALFYSLVRGICGSVIRSNGTGKVGLAVEPRCGWGVGLFVASCLFNEFELPGKRYAVRRIWRSNWSDLRRCSFARTLALNRKFRLARNTGRCRGSPLFSFTAASRILRWPA